MTIFLVWQQCPSMLCIMIIHFVTMHQCEIKASKQVNIRKFNQIHGVLIKCLCVSQHCMDWDDEQLPETHSYNCSMVMQCCYVKNMQDFKIIENSQCHGCKLIAHTPCANTSSITSVSAAAMWVFCNGCHIGSGCYIGNQTQMRNGQLDLP